MFYLYILFEFILQLKVEDYDDDDDDDDDVNPIVPRAVKNAKTAFLRRPIFNKMS